MDPEVKGWLDLLQGGGNVAMIIGAMLAWKVFQRFEGIMERVTDRLTRIERAVIVGNPAALKILDPPPS